MKPLANKTYIVTGGASGIGLAAITRILEDGGSALAVDLRPDALQQSFPGENERVATLALDVTADGSDQRMVEAAVERFGRLDGLVACAGRIKLRPLQDVTREDWEAILRLNLTSVFFYARAVAEHIKQAGHSGSMVTISATSAHGPRPNNVDYGVSKIGIDHVTRTLALEYAPAGVLVNAVSPGPTLTERLDTGITNDARIANISKETAIACMVERIPMGRIASPEEVADAVVFLASSRASYITGVNIMMDGSLVPLI